MPTINDEGGSDDRDKPTRRTVISGLGGAVGVAMAGCLGDEGGEDTASPTDTEAAGEEPMETESPTPVDVDLSWKNPHGNFEAELNYNPWDPKNHGGNMAQANLGMRDPRRMEFVSENLGGPVSDWTFKQGEEVIFDMADLKWHNGEDYVAEDLAIHYRLHKQAIGEDAGPWKYIDQVYAEDDSTLVFNLTTDAIWGVIRGDFFNPGITRPASPRFLFTEHLEALQDATSEDATEQAKTELFEKKIPVEDNLGDGPPNGFTPWKPVDVRSKRIISELWEDHPWADNFNFKQHVSVNLNLMKEQGIQMTKSGELDAHKLPLSPDTEEDFTNDPDITVRSAFKLQTTALLINQDHPILGKPNVRRGLAYMIDREKVAKQIFPATPAVKPYPVPYSRSFIDEFVGDIKGDLFKYETDREKGAELLREAGLSKEGGEWVGPDSEPLDIQFVSPPAKALDIGSTAISNQLKRLNFPHDLVDKPGSYMWSQGYTQSPPGYDLCVGPWVFGFHPIDGLGGAFIEAGDQPPEIGISEEITFPSEIGNLDSDPKTVNAPEVISEMPFMGDEELSNTIKELTWAYNSQVYSYGINQKHMHHTWRTDHWEVAPKDTPGMGQGHASKMVAKRPLMKAKEKYAPEVDLDKVDEL